MICTVWYLHVINFQLSSFHISSYIQIHFDHKKVDLQYIVFYITCVYSVCVCVCVCACVRARVLIVFSVDVYVYVY